MGVYRVETERQHEQHAAGMQRKRRRISLWSWVGLGLLAACALGCKKRSSNPANQVAPEERYLVVAQEQQATWVRNFNPLLSPSSVRWPTPSGIYEPLLIFNAISRTYVPWLATQHAFSEDNRALRFTLRDGVKWSDGAPFGVRDVVFTFELLKQHPALDQHAVWKVLESVEASGEREVVFRFSRVFTPVLFRIAQQPIVPEHVWKDVADPVAFANPEPVATGPFTVVRTFQNQIYELGKNPNYWQPGKPEIAGLRFPAYPSNESAALALMNGEIDWSGKFIPDIERVYVAKDPAHHQYWFPNLGTVHSVYVNHARPPFDDVRLRKALSMAINRERLTRIALHGYTKPIRPNGLSRAYDDWSNPSVFEDSQWVSHAPDAANALLDSAGFARGPDGTRQSPSGTPLRFTFNVVNGWSDWISAVQLMIQDFKQIGVAVEMKTLAYSAFFDALQRGDYDLSYGWVEEGPTPYTYYRFIMSSALSKPVGEPAAMNWNRFRNEEVDAALTAFELTRDPQEERALANRLQTLYTRHAPVLPLYPSPSWGIANTTRFEGFPSEQDPYARLSPFSSPEYLLVLTRVRPRPAATP